MREELVSGTLWIPQYAGVLSLVGNGVCNISDDLTHVYPASSHPL